jgi:hypothetical protein
LWKASQFIGDPDKFGKAYEEYVGTSSTRAWALIEMMSPNELSSKGTLGTKRIDVDERIIRILARTFRPESGFRKSGFVGPREDYKSSEAIAFLIDQVANNLSDEAAACLKRLVSLDDLREWRAKFLHSIRSNAQKRREKDFKYQSVEQVIEVLSNGKPCNARDLKEFILEHLDALASEYKGGATDSYKKFWRIEGKKLVSPQSETYCRDRIAEDLETRIKAFSMHIEPEGTHKAQKSSDIKVVYGSHILPIEIKKNNNKEIWTGLTEQLQNQYSIDPKAMGYGLYLGLWFGKEEQCSLPRGAKGKKPESALELKNRLVSQIPEDHKNLVEVLVIDLSIPLTSKKKKLARNKTTKKKISKKKMDKKNKRIRPKTKKK